MERRLTVKSPKPKSSRRSSLPLKQSPEPSPKKAGDEASEEHPPAEATEAAAAKASDPVAASTSESSNALSSSWSNLTETGFNRFLESKNW